LTHHLSRTHKIKDVKKRKPHLDKVSAQINPEERRAKLEQAILEQKQKQKQNQK
jgi:hypothetical protein